MRVPTLSVLFALFTGPASAQLCGTPDNLTGPCCVGTVATLPDFPAIDGMAASGICWQSCDQPEKEPATVVFTPPVEVDCGRYFSEVDIIDPVGGVMGGVVNLDYTRTWREVNLSLPGEPEYQVWRFVAKIELSPDPFGPVSCWRPPCLDEFHDAFFYGYVDFAQNCETDEWEQVVVLFHACDAFAHVPGLSAQPALAPLHPDEYYAIVGPDTGVNPFDPSAIDIAPYGVTPNEAVRPTRPPGVFGPCVYEEKVGGGELDHVGAACLCPFGFLPAAQSAARVLGVGSCTPTPSLWFSLKLFPTFAWYDLISTSLGSWTTDASYPGFESPFASEGFFLYVDACADDADEQLIDVFYGGMTSGGFDVFPIEPAADYSNAFVDLASNYSEPLSGPHFLPILGSVQETDHLIYLNPLFKKED